MQKAQRQLLRKYFPEHRLLPRHNVHRAAHDAHRKILIVGCDKKLETLRSFIQLKLSVDIWQIERCVLPGAWNSRRPVFQVRHWELAFQGKFVERKKGISNAIKDLSSWIWFEWRIARPRRCKACVCHTVAVQFTNEFPRDLSFVTEVVAQSDLDCSYARRRTDLERSELGWWSCQNGCLESFDVLSTKLEHSFFVFGR